MKKVVLILLLTFGYYTNSYSQENDKIERAAMDYLEGFYEGDTTKIVKSIHPSLSKFGYGFDKKTGAYKKGSQMTYQGAIRYAREVNKNPKWAAPKDAIKKVEILDVQEKIACVKVTAYWGVDYMLLAKNNNKWMITKVLWQSVPKKQN